MQKEKKRRLEQAGWTVGDAYEFLGTTDVERAFIETKLALATGLQERRQRQGLTQAEVAKYMASSQSRVAKMEAADSSVSIDLMVRALYRLGASRAEVARMIRPRKGKSAP